MLDEIAFVIPNSIGHVTAGPIVFPMFEAMLNLTSSSTLKVGGFPVIMSGEIPSLESQVPASTGDFMSLPFTGSHGMPCRENISGTNPIRMLDMPA